MWFSFEEKGYGFLEVEAVFIEAMSTEEASRIFSEHFGHDPFVHCSHGEKFWVQLGSSLEEASKPVREQVNGTYESMTAFLQRKNILIFEKQVA